ncbi:histidine kinase dimerization/phospho-acceptor domain-containing protein, partial [Frateuria sp.]|uniref:histidine kinase dimerization/phospho-acceptor domain-containing protein n=1 Tax=Frateuria sp. TaxID=2211372 RepID=UPI001849D916
MTPARAATPLPAAVAAEDSAFNRLWFGFAAARVVVGLVLTALLTAVRYLNPAAGVSNWVLGMCSAYFLAALAARLLLRPVRPGKTFDPQWVSSIGIDLVVFSALQFANSGGIYFPPLFAVPVLMASVLGSTPLALGTAAGVALLLLAEAWVQSLTAPIDLAQKFLQAGLTGTGFFALAFLSHQLALRLAREEEAARAGRKAAQMHAQVNQLVIDTLTQGVLVIDADGQVHAANPAARELLGASFSRAPGLSWLLADPAWKPLLLLAQQTFASRSPQMADMAIQPVDAPARRMSARAHLSGSPDQPADALCVVFLEDLRELEARMRTEKLASMGRMSTAVAHEIRNPLAAITQANELLEEDLQRPEHRQLSGLVRQNAQRLAQIVDEILDIARVQRQGEGPSPAMLALDPAVRDGAGDWISHHRSGDHVRVALEAAGVTVLFEGDHLRRVLVNLLDNALRYASEEPGAIQVVTSTGDAPTLTVWRAGA